MNLLSLTFGPDGAANQRRSLRAALAGPLGAETLDAAATPAKAFTALYRLRWADAEARLLCEQAPPPSWARAIAWLGLERRTAVFAHRWPRKAERAPLPHADWRCPTPALAAAWKQAGAQVVFVSTEGKRTPAPQPTLAEGDTILWAGPLLLHAGARSALWTFDVLDYLAPRLHLLIAGEGPDGTELRRFAAGLGPRARIRFAAHPSEADWRRVRMVWVNDATTAVPDVWLEAAARGMAGLIGQAHAATGRLPVAQAALKPHDPPAWAKATLELLRPRSAAA